jgi:Fe2+ transport system protein B
VLVIERNMNLTLQVLEITDRAVLCLNLMDEAKRHGIEIDDRTLAKKLGIPVIPTSARTQEGIPELLKTIEEVASEKIKCKPHRIKNLPKKLASAVDSLSQRLLEEYPNLPNSRWVAMRLLDGDQEVMRALNEGDFQIETV